MTTPQDGLATHRTINKNLGRYTDMHLHPSCQAANLSMNLLVKKYVWLTLMTGTFLAGSGSSYSAETPPIISKIQSIAAQDGYTKAIQTLDKEFGRNKDLKLELLILKAQLSSKNQKTNEAIEIYKSLIKDYPSNLIAHNNLATIYANEGDLDAAEMVLLNGFRQQADVDTAYQNLMKIKGKQASMALQLVLDPLKTTQKSLQLTALNHANEIDLSTPQVALAQVKPPAVISPENSKIEIAINTTITKPTPPLTRTEKTNQDSAPINTESESKAKESKIPPTQAASPPAPPVDIEISKLLKAWAQAWSTGSAEGYLAFYSEKFIPDGQIGLAKWTSQRRQRINPKQDINVRLENIEIKVKKSDLIEVVFNQFYTSQTLKARANKKITLEKNKNQWKIIREEVVK
jgi:hypothetical protein